MSVANQLYGYTELVVKNVNWKGHYKRLSAVPAHDHCDTSHAEGRIYIDLPLSACVSHNDTISVIDRNLYVECRNGRSQIAPAYLKREKISVGGLRVSTLIKEVTQEDEHRGCLALAKYHYRDQPLFGRTARLIARTFHPAYPKVLGYIELATPFYMNKARAELFDAPFRNGSVSWDSWDMQATRENIHTIVRIARCVVHPEFRGLRLGQLLAKHAAEFARTRWQVARMLPYFMEISADMLKYVPFAERAGMLFIGETEGNLDRVAEDMGYLMKNADRVRNKEIVSEESCGIVDQQVARMERVLKLQEAEDLTRTELLAKLERLSAADVLRDYALFWDVISLPKPTYIKGLNKKASRFIKRRVAEVAPKNGWKPPSLEIDPLSSAIEIDNVSLSYTSQVRRTRITHAVQQAFGISPENIHNLIVQDLSLVVQPREVILITGPSGSGKTTILDVLARDKAKEGLTIEGRINYPDNTVAGAFEPIRSRKALVEIFSASDRAGSVHGAMHLMGNVGLSDAFVFLKRYSDLSKGQQYRAMLADLISRRANVWLIDEFCTNLDTVTANVVADRLQKMARSLGATLIAAAPNCELFLHALRPDKVLRLTSAWEHSVLDGEDFMAHLEPPDRWRNRIRQLRLKPSYFTAVCHGEKTQTIRKNRLSVQRGPLLFACGSKRLLVNVNSVTHLALSELTEEHARRDGFASLQELLTFLRETYSAVNASSVFTIIQFERF